LSIYTKVEINKRFGKKENVFKLAIILIFKGEEYFMRRSLILAKKGNLVRILKIRVAMADRYTKRLLKEQRFENLNFERSESFRGLSSIIDN